MHTPAPTPEIRSHRNCDVLVGGAGIIGLATALALAREGLSVTVLEQGRAMCEASWAAAGMLAAHDPENSRALDALAELSVELYPEFLAEVEQLSGMAVPLRTTTTWQGSHAGAVEPEQPAGRLLADLPALNPGARTFTRLDEHSLDPRDLCAALPIAVRAAGVTLLEQTRVSDVQAEQNGVLVCSEAGNFKAGAYLHCCGAWSGEDGALPSLSLAQIPVEPRKGQMLSVLMPADGPKLACVVRTPELYLVPRGDGRIVIGATVEHAGFDRSISLAATDALLEEAAELWPPVRAGRVMERWSGLRPATPDGLPIFDSLAGSGVPDAWIATGHFRNGILLAPATARLLVQLVLGQPPLIDMSPFRLHRFQPAPASARAASNDKVSALRYN